MATLQVPHQTVKQQHRQELRKDCSFLDRWHLLGWPQRQMARLRQLEQQQRENQPHQVQPQRDWLHWYQSAQHRKRAPLLPTPVLYQRAMVPLLVVPLAQRMDSLERRQQQMAKWAFALDRRLGPQRTGRPALLLEPAQADQMGFDSERETQARDSSLQRRAMLEHLLRQELPEKDYQEGILVTVPPLLAQRGILGAAPQDPAAGFGFGVLAWAKIRVRWCRLWQRLVGNVPDSHR